MAVRNLLSVNKMESFEEYLRGEGYMILPLSKNPYEVLRAKKGRDVVIIYRRSEAREHLSIADKDYELVRGFLERESAGKVPEVRRQKEELEDGVGLPWE